MISFFRENVIFIGASIFLIGLIALQNSTSESVTVSPGVPDTNPQTVPAATPVSTVQTPVTKTPASSSVAVPAPVQAAPVQPQYRVNRGGDDE